MHKRGSSEIDWAISLAVFILFVTWFFMFLKPQLDVEYNKKGLVSMVKTDFETDFSWTLRKVPLIIKTEDYSPYTPIFINFSIGWDNFDFAGGSTDYVFESDRLFLLGNISSNVTILWMLNGGNYTHANNNYGLTAEAGWATTSANFSVTFEDRLPDIMYFRNAPRVNHTAYYLNGQQNPPGTMRNFTDYGILARYFSGNDSVNTTVYVFARNSRLLYEVESSHPESEPLYTLSFALVNYSNYYSDNINFGQFYYSERPKNITYEFDTVTLYDLNESLSIYLNMNATLEMAYYNDTVYLNITAPLSSPFEAQLVFHEGDFALARKADYSYTFGVVESVKGLHEESLAGFNYTAMKAKWAFPYMREFQIIIWNGTKGYASASKRASYLMGDKLLPSQDIYLEQVDYYMLEETGDLRPVYAGIKVW